MTDFALPVSVSIAGSGMFAALDIENMEDEEALDTLLDGIWQGCAQLYDGLDELAAGTDSLAQGALALRDGLAELSANNETLVAGSAQVFETLLAQASEQMAQAGLDVPALTIENYADTLSSLIESMSEEGIERAAREKVEQTVRAQEDTIRAGVEQAVREQVRVQVSGVVRTGVAEQVLGALDMTQEDYEAAGAGGALSGEQIAAIEGQIDAQMNTDAVQALVSQKTEETMAGEETQALIEEQTQLQELIEQNMASSGVQKEIQQNVQLYREPHDQLAALKEQLDGYNTFHTGLIAYTQGVSGAAEGAAELLEGADALNEGAEALLDGVRSIREKLDSADIEGLAGRVRALILAAQQDVNYSGIAADMDGSVRYIWRTDAIEP